MNSIKNTVAVLFALLLGSFAQLHAQSNIKIEQVTWGALERAVMSAVLR